MPLTAAPTENHHIESTSDRVAPSDPKLGISIEEGTKPPKASLNTSTDNIKRPTKTPTGPFDTHENLIEEPSNVLIGSSESHVPTMIPVTAPTNFPMNVNVSIDEEPLAYATYIPGKLTKVQNSLLLSEGLEARIIAETGKPVPYSGGSSSRLNFHIFPDAGATFTDTRWWNEGGWIYVSNSEAKNESEGGVGAITFDKYGSIVHYRMVLENTHINCGGGRTPWNTWVSCEEVEFSGQIYQVDPTGQRPSERMTIGSSGGRWESFAYDIRERKKPRFFTTEDHNKGCTRRFTPEVIHWGGDEWKMLHEVGIIDYLFVHPNANRTGGNFEWIDDLEVAKNNARAFYPQSEGIDIQDGKMYIVCKNIQQLFVFDLDKMTFYNVSTVSGLFDGGPDQMQRILGSKGGLLYFTEEGGENAGVHARDEFGRFFTILESPFLLDETTGLAFSPNGKHMYIAYQENGILFDVTREDGLAFDAQSLDVKYHRSMSSRHLNSQWIGM
eukprot:CAMPEP_0197200236 /NCGR_PEP_ID=MMETSP1423-20130617/34294_1 /TAXON_ID=476441 /ORGANISM="Pseudo-nitzschia heimii, Strain UNC1101" /LENGTH=497 /DNA_ID=CAMNT_0042654111 /DNA_START=408 /DNA_END=1901 /DNA_ORIENTATION=-